VFGKEILDKDGAIDRTKLGDLIFSNTQKRRQLNKIMHRRIFWKMLSEFWELRMRQKHQLIIIDAPLLYETKFLEYFCYPIIVVGITEDDILVKRMMTRDKINEEQAKNKIKAQMPIEDKIEKGDIVINNNGNVNHLVNELKNTVIPGIYEKLNFKD
jgi:dephospho-CoA kinase